MRHHVLVDETVLFSLLAALAGGTVGSAITAGAGLVQSGRASRERAAVSLWEYHRALLGFASKNYSELGFGEDQAFMASASFKEVVSAYETAYPWAGYLRPAARRELFRIANIEIGQIPWNSPDDILVAANSSQKLADRLERELERVFPLRFWDRVRALFPSRYNRPPTKIAKKVT